MNENQDLPFSKLVKMHDRMFRQAVCGVLLERFSEQVRANYVVAGWAQLPSGEWVIELERTLDSYD